MDSHSVTEGYQTLIFENELILYTIFGHLPVTSLCYCRQVNWIWNRTATNSIRKSLQKRLLLCADSKTTAFLTKCVEVFKNGSTIPYSRAILVLDHLPQQGLWKKETRPQIGEVELMHHMSDLFSDHFSRRGSDPFVPILQEDGHTVKAACDLFENSIENLIVNLTLHRETPENMEYWLSNVRFCNVHELNFHITCASPESLSAASLASMMNSLTNLRSFCLRKLTKKGERLMNDIITSLRNKFNLNRVKSLSLELFTDDRLHLESLIQSDLCLERLSLIYLGGEIRFTNKIDLIKQLLSTVSKTLQHLHTHLPLFSKDHRNIPKLPRLRTLKIEKVYREFSTPHSHIFDFDFSYYFPNIEKIFFKDYDIWKNMSLKTFPVEKILSCKEVVDVKLPDLCFDAPLMERYLLKFPNLRVLSLIVSYVSRYQKQCSYCLVYSSLPRLKELNIQIFEVDIPMYDQLFTGMTDEKCFRLQTENRQPNQLDRDLSIVNLKELEVLRITSINRTRDLGISDLSVTFGFIQMRSLRRLCIGASRITPQGLADMAKKFDVTVLNKSDPSTPSSPAYSTAISSS